ncbi:hypothetical protein RHOSPDRAFT_32873 [Rhodotorula sp. JG-1b]|nr:hypothetical protein RHOSPDRAFT_32873 [Rhodotorula sp. JG-1b]
MADKPWRRHLVSLHNPHPSPLSGTQDLISHFQLEPLYDTFLRPYLPSSLTSVPVDAADQLSVGAPSNGGAPPLSSTQATTLPLPVPGQVVLPTNRSKLNKATTSPAPPSTPGGGGGFKITLGGIKLAGLTSPALASASTAASSTAATHKKPKRPKMEKSYDYMVGDVLGRISQPRSASSSGAASSLLHLVSNPDPAPCPPLHPFDPHQLREAFTLKPGGLAGFDMTIWEARDPSGTGASAGGGFGEERRRKKKKRKHDDPNNIATDPKKQRR